VRAFMGRSILVARTDFVVNQNGCTQTIDERGMR
jgi:hypothetical protein